jgi:hypothetical protein
VSPGTCIDLSAYIEEAIKVPHRESWWQTFIQENIIKIVQGYDRCFPKINVSIGKTKYPDFLLQTHDRYVDILEIKKANAPLLWYDKSHDNYCLEKSISAAISQTEHYIKYVQEHSFELQAYIKEKYKTDVRIVSPKGIILAGDTRGFSQQEKDDFRLLTQGHTKIRFITYDELLIFCKKPDEKSLT